MALATERQRPAADVDHTHGARHSNSGTSGHDGRKMATRTLRERNDGRVLLHQRANGARSPLPLMYSRIATATTAAATVPKVDRGARMSSVRGLHCNGCASTATASTAMSSLSVSIYLSLYLSIYLSVALFSMPCRMPVFAAVQRLCFVCVLAAALVSLAMRVRCLTLRRLVGSPRCNYGS